MRYTEKDYAYPIFHGKADCRLRRGDLVRIEVVKRSKSGKYNGTAYLGLGEFLGCEGRGRTRVEGDKVFCPQMPIFRLPPGPPGTGRLIAGCECWWVRYDTARQVEAKVLLPVAVRTAVEAAEAVSRVLKVRPIHVQVLGYKALIEWKTKLHYEGFWFSLSAMPGLDVSGNKLARMIAKQLKVPVCRAHRHRVMCRHVRRSGA